MKSLCFYAGCVKQRAPLSLRVHSFSFSYVAQGLMPKSKELLFLCRNVGTGQHSALLHCLCFSPHLTPSPIFSASLSSFFCSSCLTLLSFNTLSLCLISSPFASSSLLFRLLTHSFPIIPVSACYLDSCFYFLSHISQSYILTTSLSLSLSASLPLKLH